MARAAEGKEASLGLASPDKVDNQGSCPLGKHREDSIPGSSSCCQDQLVALEAHAQAA